MAAWFNLVVFICGVVSTSATPSMTTKIRLQVDDTKGELLAKDAALLGDGADESLRSIRKDTTDEIESFETRGEKSEYVSDLSNQQSRATMENPSVNPKGLAGDVDISEGWEIPGQYIVVFQETVNDTVAKAADLIDNYSAAGTALVLWHYQSSFRGLALQGVDDAMVEFLRIDPQIKYIEQDVRVSLDSVVSRNTQHNPPNWGLDRIDELLLLAQDGSALDNGYHFDQTGVGVTVFVLDTGIRRDHKDFIGHTGESRISCGFDAFPANISDEYPGCFDGVGHGTHMAGIIGGYAYGVAKDADIVSIRVFSDEGAGSVASVLSGIDFIHEGKLVNPDRPTVANLSFGTPGKLQSFSESVEALVKLDVTVIASSGNDGSFACQKSPAYMDEVVTVAASTFEDKLAPFSNIGDCADIFAPGDRVTSAWKTSISDQATISGTSTAAAHVAGVAALYMEKYPQMQPDEVKSNLQQFAEHNAVQGIPENTKSINLMLNMASLSLV